MILFFSYREIRRRYLPWACFALIAVASFSLSGVWRGPLDLQAVQAMSWAVAGRRVVVDPGHGGEDPGKVSDSGIYEKDINLQVAKKLRSLLIQGGASVIMTREEDVALGADQDTLRERKRTDLMKRAELAVESGADIYVSLHCNAFPKSRFSGAQVFYAPQAAGALALAQAVQAELSNVLNNTERQPSEDITSFVLKQAKIPTVNVEMGFLSNPLEEQLLTQEEYQEKIAWAVYSGIVRYYSN
ncbi:MAG: N-acetylmuramoyl-L-alanine amidase [Peptococcaceae bacterium]|nr:N-acetylmuramoyl-L-alanine amidase [Peptococcaceae bacterium]